jgi:hypothetical protein
MHFFTAMVGITVSSLLAKKGNFVATNDMHKRTTP